MRAIIHRILYLAAITALVLAITSCTRTVYVPTPPSVKTEYVYRDHIVRDTAYVHDTDIVRVAGDTVYVIQSRIEYQEKMVVETDTIVRSDTIVKQYPITVTEYVEKKLSLAQRILITLGWIFILIFVAITADALIRHR